MTIFTGTDEDDIFTGGLASDTATGGLGDDRLSGGQANDVLAGNAGADVLNGGDGDDTLYSGDISPYYRLPYSDNEVIAPLLDTGTDIDTLIGGEGSDTIFAGYGDTVDGGDGSDALLISFQRALSGIVFDSGLSSQVIGGATISNIEHTVWLEGSEFEDQITIGRWDYGSAPVFGMGGNDHINAGYYTSVIEGGEGDDVLYSGEGLYLFSALGGAGNDVIYSSSRSTRVEGGDGNDILYTGGGAHGGAGNDRIFVNGGENFYSVYGDAGNDVIFGSYNASVLIGGAGKDRLVGGNASEVLYSADYRSNNYDPTTAEDDMTLAHDRLSGGGGDDIIAIGYGDDADGGEGSDTLRLSLGGLKTGIVFDTAGIVSGQPFTLGGGVIQNVETLVYLRGSEHADVLTLATQDTLLEVNAGAGDDRIISDASSVSVSGGSGDDWFVSGLAGDIFDGGSGSDTVDYSNSLTGVTVNLSTGSGGRGDQLTKVENVVGTSADDVLTGNDSDNRLTGGAGADTLSSGKGYDTLLGGVGGDALTGGAGADTFVYLAVADSTKTVFDRIADLSTKDWIDLSAIDARTDVEDDQAFAIVDAFTGVSGQMTLKYSAATAETIILMDVNGDGVADMKIVASGDHRDFAGFIF